MSLKVANLATVKQKATLERLGYYGMGSYGLDVLTVQEAAELITELFEEERLTRRRDQEDKGDLFDLLDPFNQINK